MERSEEKELRTSDAWVFVIGGILAVLVTPYLVEIAAGAEHFLLVVAFGALVGACDASQAEDGMEATLRTASGIALGLIAGVSLEFSTWLAGAVLGAGVVASRWFWLPESDRNPSAALAAALIAGTGLWLVPPGFSAGWATEWSAHLPAVVWGFCGAVAAMSLDIPRLMRTPASTASPTPRRRLFSRPGSASDTRSEESAQIAKVRAELMAALKDDERDEGIQEVVDAALDAWRQVVDQQRLIASYNPKARRREIERRHEKLREIGGEEGGGEELQAALEELEEEMLQCEQIDGVATALWARQERLRSALERLRLDLLQRRCDGLYEYEISSRLDGINELVGSSKMEREVFSQLLAGDSSGEFTMLDFQAEGRTMNSDSFYCAGGRDDERANDDGDSQSLDDQ